MSYYLREEVRNGRDVFIVIGVGYQNHVGALGYFTDRQFAHYVVELLNRDYDQMRKAEP